MHSEEEMRGNWKDLMGTDGSAYIETTAEIAGRCDVEFSHDVQLPKIDWGIPSKRMLRQQAVKGMKERGLTGPVYVERLKHEVSVVEGLGFEDYFLLCFDMVEYARKNKIRMGFGRGSVGGSLLAYCLGIIGFDPVATGCDFERFLRPDKKSMPDIDLDFDSNRRDEVIEYMMQRFAGKASRIATYGYYRVANLVNDLCKYMDVPDEDKNALRTHLEAMEPEPGVTPREIASTAKIQAIMRNNPKLLKHFCKLTGQIRFIGKHAGGVAVAADEIDKVVAVQRNHGSLQTAFDLSSLNAIGVLKMDVLSLNTVSATADAEDLAGVSFSMDKLDDQAVMTHFREADTNGIFQFDKRGAKEILRIVQPMDLSELVACVSLNRPAPLKLGMPAKYAAAKEGEYDETVPWYEHVKETYGVLLYQEQVMNICKHFAGMEWKDVDKVMKGIRDLDAPDLKKKFVEGASAPIPEEEAENLWDSMTLYLFNKGHGTAYALLAYWAMWLRHYHPLEFFLSSLRNEGHGYKRLQYESDAVRRGVVILLPHVNGSVQYEIKEIDGEQCIQEGLTVLDGVGTVVSKTIIEGAPYEDEHDFNMRPLKGVGPRMKEILKDAGALEFDQQRFLKRCVDYCSVRFARDY